MITILTTTGAYTLSAATDWARGPDGDVHLYDDSSDGTDDSLATFDADAFVAALNGLPADAQHALADDHDPQPSAVATPLTTLREPDTDDADT
jgi:hypothetical protein